MWRGSRNSTKKKEQAEVAGETSSDPSWLNEMMGETSLDLSWLDQTPNETSLDPELVARLARECGKEDPTEFVCELDMSLDMN